MLESETEVGLRYAPMQRTTEVHRHGVTPEMFERGINDFMSQGRRFRCQVGDLDLWHESKVNVMHMVCSIERCRDRGSSFTYTGMRFDSAGQLHFFDYDVVPTPYELCLIYQEVERIREEK